MEKGQHNRHEAAILWRTCLQGWPLDGIWELGFGGVFPLSLTDKCVLIPCTNNMVYAEHLLSFWESGILVCARHPAPSKNLWYWILNESQNHFSFCLSGQKHFTLELPFVAGVRGHFVVPHGREGASKEACPWVPPASACVCFQCHPAVRPESITVTGLSLEHNCVLRLWVLSNLWTWGALGDPQHKVSPATGERSGMWYSVLKWMEEVTVNSKWSRMCA